MPYEWCICLRLFTSMLPQVQLNFYSEMTTLTRHENDTVCTYVIDTQTLANALNHVSLCSGFLPPHIVGHGQRNQQAWVAGYFPPSQQTVQVEQTLYTVPFPGAILLGCGQQYVLYAVKRKPRSGTEPLYLFPAPNVHTHGGKICQGNASFPAATAASLIDAYALFFASGFNGDYGLHKVRAETTILAFWQTLDGRMRFPLRHLRAPTHPLTIDDLFKNFA